jgi:2-amino-4-hydroxy-6-hydroxymethyldihydropteridine diphosphokinase
VDNLPAVAYVGVGANILPAENIIRALERLALAPGIRLSGISTFYRTAPLPDPSEAADLPDKNASIADPDFLNGVLELRTSLSTEELLKLFAEIEKTLGRSPSANRYAPRTMDLDLLLFGWVGDGSQPPAWEEIGGAGFFAHRDIANRAFVAYPLLELAPGLLLPPHGTPLQAFTASFGKPEGRPQETFTNQLRKRFLPH